jgi:hypothetical protein
MCAARSTALYDAALWPRCAMVGLLGMVLLSIVGRQFHFHLPGTDAYAGYLMAAAGFLALAHTLKRGEHIRVTLLLRPWGCARRALELWSLAAASLLAGCSRSTPAGWRGSRTSSTTSRPATTRRRCGSRSWPWRSGTGAGRRAGRRAGARPWRGGAPPEGAGNEAARHE